MRSGCTFLGAEGAAMGAVSADLSARQYNFKSEVRFHLLAHFLKRRPEIFFDFAAAEADNMRMFFLEARLVIMLIAGVVHQVELVDKSTFFEQFERSIDGDAIELGIFFLGKLIQALGIKMEAGVVDQVEQDAALTGQPDASVTKSVLDAGGWHS